jgi:chromosome segregation ATPase
MQTDNPPIKRARAKRNKGTEPVSQIDSTEARLTTHEQVCSERYKALETRMNSVEKRMDGISADVKELKQSNEKQFSEIKSMLSNAKDDKFKTMVTVAGTIILGLITTMGYLITHLPK